MTNQELELKLKELLQIKDYCEYAIAVKQFNKEYKQTSFYKQTKISLKRAIQEARLHYIFNIDNVIDKTQKFINSLNFENVQKIIDQFSEMYASENKDIAESIELLKDLMGNGDTKN